MNDNTRSMLDKILNIDKWQAVQDSIANITRLAIITVDYKGESVTEHSKCNGFCEKIRHDPVMSLYCKKCDSRGGLEAVRLNKPYIYLCPYDIVDIAIPIIVNNNYAGAVMAGQVRLNDECRLEKILSLPNTDAIKSDAAMSRLYNELPELSYREIAAATDMLYKICNYVIEESLNKNLLIDMYERLYSVEKPLPHRDEALTLNDVDLMKAKLSDAITNSFVKPNAPQDIQNPVLKPAIEYIHKNIAEDITVEKLTKICNVSAGYLSRLFVKETGETFTEYRNRLKIKLACGMLLNSDKSLTAISDALGFSDPSYFNRIFKKFQNTTPAMYRKFNK